MATATSYVSGHGEWLQQLAASGTATQSAAPDQNESPTAWAPPAELRQIVQDDRRVMQELLSMFLDDSAARVDALRNACLRHDTGTIQAQSRSLKGSALQVGATRLAGMCALLQSCENPDPAARSSMLSHIEEEIAKLQSDMEDYLFYVATPVMRRVQQAPGE